MLLYADEDFPDPCAEGLRGLGHDVLTVHQDGRDGSADTVVLARAFELGRVILTHNRRHFKYHHREGLDHAGIVSTGHDADFDALALRIHIALTGRTAERWHLLVDKGGVREE